jgi:hypothetical protein
LKRAQGGWFFPEISTKRPRLGKWAWSIGLSGSYVPEAEVEELSRRQSVNADRSPFIKPTILDGWDAIQCGVSVIEAKHFSELSLHYLRIKRRHARVRTKAATSLLGSSF